MNPGLVDSGLLLAVDGGNTKTDAVVVDRTGRVRGVGRSGTSDMYAPAGETGARIELRAAIARATSAAGVRPRDLSGAAVRLAGIDWPEDEAAWRSWSADEFGLELPLSLDNDGVAGLRCISASGVGVALTVGTGYAVGARGPDGNRWSLNFWGQHQLGAIGLGQAGYRAVMLAELGLGPATDLHRRLLAFTGCSEAAELLHAVTNRHNDYSDRSFALMAPEVTASALAGDAVSVSIVAQQSVELCDYIGLAARRVGLDEEFSVVLAGSVVRAPGSVVTAALRRAIAERLPRARLVDTLLPPVAGVALDVLVEAGVVLDDEIRRRLSDHFVLASAPIGTDR